jgi:TonB family protein
MTMRPLFRVVTSLVAVWVATGFAQDRVLSQQEAAARLLTVFEVKYPPLARQARISGNVRLEVSVGADGSVADARIVSGHPLLSAAATASVRRLQFLPLEQDGQNVGFRYQQDVNFRMVEPVPMRQPKPPRATCRWRDEDVERALICLERLSEKTSEEYEAWAGLELWRGDSIRALQILESGLPGTSRRFLELAESMGQFEEARLKACGNAPM